MNNQTTLWQCDKPVPLLDQDARMAEICKRPNVLEHWQAMERRIVWELSNYLQSKGFTIHAVFDGDDYTKVNNDIKAAMELIFNLDEASLRITHPDYPDSEHGVLFIMGNGNGGRDLIADWNYETDDRDGFDAAMEAFDPEYNRYE